MNKHVKFLSISLVAACSLIFVAKVQAVEVSTDYVPLTTVPGVFKQGEITNPVKILKNLYGFAIGIGSIIAVVMIMYAGFEYMYVESISGKSGAKEKITNAFLGLLVILGSYILLRTINPALVNFDVRLPSGSGRVSVLTGIAAAQDAAHANANRVLTQSANLQKKIGDLEGEAKELQELINYPDADPDEKEAAEKRLKEVTIEIHNSRAQDFSIRAQADQQTVVMAIDATILTQFSGTNEGQDISTLAASNITVRQNSAREFFNRELQTLSSLDQSNPEVQKAIKEVTMRRDSMNAEFLQQNALRGVLSPAPGTNPGSRQTSATNLANIIRRDSENHGKALRDAGLVAEARQYQERANSRINAICAAKLCGN